MVSEHIPERQVSPIILGDEVLDLLGVIDLSMMRVLNQWDDLGSETLVSDFMIYSDENKPIHLIAKKCIKNYPECTVNSWLRRRDVLSEHGVLFPNIYALDSARGLWIEEFIPYSFEEAYIAATPYGQDSLESGLHQLYVRISNAGFNINVPGLHDLRSHGTDIVMIDTGMDIGGQKTVCGPNIEVSARRSVVWNLGRCGIQR